MPTNLRERLKALVRELHQQAALYRRGQELFDEQQARAYTQCARKLTAILAESEPGCEVCAERAREADESARFLSDVEEGKRILAESENEPPCRHGKDCIECEQEREPPSLPLGHEFIAYRGYFVESDTCIYLGCGQPRSAHEPKDRA